MRLFTLSTEAACGASASHLNFIIFKNMDILKLDKNL